MFGRTSLFLVAIFAIFSFSSPESTTDHRVQKVFARMYDSIRNIKTVRQDVVAIERLENEVSISRSKIKLQTLPVKIYFINPSKKLEVLFNPEFFQNKALVKPHVFPYLTMQLDPRGNIMRKNQHYSIMELGYSFIGKSIALTINKDKDGLSNFSYKGKTVKNGFNCHLIEYENKKYTYVDYKVGERETASSIALKLCVNDYLLRYNNDLLNDFGYLKKGSIIKVPTLYCQKAVLFIDDHLALPISLSLFDDKGLFESYDYSNVQINVPIPAAEFSRDFSAYNF